MENITMTNTTQIIRVRFAFPRPASRCLSVGDGGAFQGTDLSSFGFGPLGGFAGDPRISVATPAHSFSTPTYKALAVKDVAHLRAWSPPV